MFEFMLACVELAWVVQLVWDGFSWPGVETIKNQKHYRKQYKTIEKHTRVWKTTKNYTRQRKTKRKT